MKDVYNLLKSSKCHWSETWLVSNVFFTIYYVYTLFKISSINRVKIFGIPDVYQFIDNYSYIDEHGLNIGDIVNGLRK